MGCPPPWATIKHQPFFRNGRMCNGASSSGMDISPEILFQPGGEVKAGVPGADG